MSELGVAFELPLDRSRLGMVSFLRDRVSRAISREQWTGVQGRAAEVGMDRFTLIVGAVGVVASRYTGASDVVVGSGAFGEQPRPLAIRIAVKPDAMVGDYLSGVQSAIAAGAVRTVNAAAGPTQPAFRLMIVPAPGSSALCGANDVPRVNALGAAAADCDVVISLIENERDARLDAEYDPELYDADTIERLLGHVEETAWQLVADVASKIEALPIVTEAERNMLVREFNATRVEYERDACVNELVERQAAKRPGDVALVFGRETLTYAELNIRANRLAHLLIARGVGPDGLVGICLERSPEMVVAVLAVLKAGGAYIPMDPGYPPNRLAYMVEDSHVRLILGDSTTAESVGHGVEVVRVDRDPAANQPESDPAQRASSTNLAYVIYTSGSTGNPKGVMVEHRNVVNFFAGMDARLGTEPGTWLAVTSLSFDISVLELLWTLTRGYRVVLYSSLVAQGRRVVGTARSRAAMEFGLFYFGSDDGESGAARGRQKYRLLMEGARFADKAGFSAVWTPERHFHTFGGMFPSPAVMAGALAMATENLSIRAGSVVLPLNNPVRVAEEWSLVDNLSDGRVAISFASGWQPQDFALAPEAYADRSERMFDGIETVRSLWRGESLELVGGDGKTAVVTTRPRSVQHELPTWVTAGGSPETFKRAGAIGANLLTHLLGQSIDELAANISLYRESWREHGHAAEGRVALMLHTFVSDDEATVRTEAHGPLKDYLKGSVGLFAPAAAARGLDVANLSAEDLDDLAEHAFERYFESGGLFGTPESCAAKVDEFRCIGVDELACLIDFGIADDVVLANLPHLDQLRQRFAAPMADAAEHSIEALVHRHSVTHFQCTPSMAAMLLNARASGDALGGLTHMMVGGEALSQQLAAGLRSAIPHGRITNMYGPTETTIWSTTHEVVETDAAISIGTPIANTQIYILDGALNPVPVGVVGDLWIGGDGVTRGYLGRAELTAERFIADPFVERCSGVESAARMYRTGDLANWRGDGTIAFVGRADHQIKLRGHRIELGEIEAVLRRRASVADVVVTLREDAPEDKRLVAYLVANPGETLEIEALREHARVNLVEAMVPSTFVVMDALPLTPNGKTDRNALPHPSTVQSQRVDSLQTPAAQPDDFESTVARIWCDVLNVPSVGLRENFFDLGGHSMLIVHVLNQLRAHTDKEIAMSDMFRHPTVQALADFIRAPARPGASIATGQDRASQRRALRGLRGTAEPASVAP